MRRSRQGGGFRSLFLIVGTAWGAVFLHSCGTPPGALDPAALGQLHEAPRLRVGLGKFIRVDSAAVVFPGPFTVVGTAGVLQRETGGPAAVALGWQDGLRVGTRVHPETSVRLTSGPDGEFELGGVRYRGDLVVLRAVDAGIDPDVPRPPARPHRSRCRSPRRRRPARPAPPRRWLPRQRRWRRQLHRRPPRRPVPAAGSG